MNESDREKLQHMVEYCRFALRFLPGGKDALDETAILALTYAVQVVGEASNQLSQSFRASQPHVPWKRIRDMRNRLVHHYFDIDVDVLWDTIANDLVLLEPLLEQLLAAEGL